MTTHRNLQVPALDTAHTSRAAQEEREELLKEAKKLALRRLGEVIKLKFPPPLPRNGAAMDLAGDSSQNLSSVTDIPSQWGGPHFGRRLSAPVGSLGIVEDTRKSTFCDRDSKGVSAGLS